MIYVIGSLRNPRVPQIANTLREHKFDVFDEWYAAGEKADDAWRAYEKAKGNALPTALKGYAAQHVFLLDKFHLDRCSAVVLLTPAGKSGHVELGWALGRGKKGYILLDSDPDRYDVMYGFADGVFFHLTQLIDELSKIRRGEK